MRLALCLGLLLLSQTSFGHETRKDQMLKRLDRIIESIREAKQKKSCKKVRQIYELYPEHLKSIVSNMNLFEDRTIELRDDAQEHLLILKRLSKNCKPEAINSDLRWMILTLRKHQLFIYTGDTDYDNDLYVPL